MVVRDKSAYSREVYVGKRLGKAVIAVTLGATVI